MGRCPLRRDTRHANRLQISGAELASLSAEGVEPIVLLLEHGTWLTARGAAIPPYTGSVDAALPGEAIAEVRRDDEAPPLARFRAAHRPAGWPETCASVGLAPTEARAWRWAAAAAILGATASAVEPGAVPRLGHLAPC